MNTGFSTLFLNNLKQCSGCFTPLMPPLEFPTRVTPWPNQTIIRISKVRAWQCTKIYIHTSAHLPIHLNTITHTPQPCYSHVLTLHPHVNTLKRIQYRYTHILALNALFVTHRHQLFCQYMLLFIWIACLSPVTHFPLSCIPSNQQ